MVLLGRLAAGAGALFMPLALAMLFYGLKNQPDDAPLAGVVAFGCGLAAVALAISESVSPADLSEDIEVLRYGTQLVVICAALESLGGGLMLAGAFDERIDSALGMR